MFFYDYPTYLGPPLTGKEKEEAEKVLTQLKEAVKNYEAEGGRIELPGRLNLAVFKTVSLANSGALQESPEGLKD